ncbi:MAG: class I SAM-dependent methyltransferase [Cellulosilyticaceae bacterium]
MKFYQELSKYYDQIFPMRKEQLEFLKEIIGSNPSSVIDIACGNGVYAIELAKIGHKVLGIDLSLGMIQKAYEQAKEEKINLELRACSMLEVDEVVSEPYEMGFCIGNSLVHLRTIQEIQSFFNLLYGVLKPKGKIVIQIINYNRILEKGITELPTLTDSDSKLVFNRNYRIDEKAQSIEFKTFLKVDDQAFENSVQLIPLKKEQLVELLNLEGFDVQAVYGSFKKEIYDQNESFHCIVVAQKH